jgi:Right handed beta helix region
MRTRALLLFVLTVFGAMSVSTRGAEPPCDLDFDNDGVFPSDLDVTAFFSVFAGGACETCDDIDINNNGAFPETQDVIAFMTRVATHSCAGERNEQPAPDGGTIAGVDTASSTETPTWIRWVAPWGNNSNPGTQSAPFATVQGALMRSNRNAHGIVYVMPGEYTMAIQWQYDNLQYGGESEDRPLVIAAAPGSVTRPILNLPNTASAGIRLVNGTNFVHVRGLEFRGRPQHTAIIAAIGSARGLVVEDCVLIGGSNGVSLQGLDGQVVRDVLVKRTIVRDQRNPATHSQGAYVSASDNVVFQDCVFYNNGNRDTFCQGVYFVHGNYSRKVLNSWFGEPGFAGIQARGGQFEITGNVFEHCGNGIGVGHPMSAPSGIWTSGTFANNLIASPVYPGWGIAVQRMNCSNIYDNIFFSTSSQGQAIVRQDTSPCANVFDNRVRGWGATFVNNSGTIASGEIDWQYLTSRPLGVWNLTYDAPTYINACRQLP